jgi:oligopeptide/dipeptide ABC transporter ATP-binding protein
MSTDLLLSISDLKVSFGNQLVLNGLNLSVRPGETVALVGESGSGKSVLARSILGLVGPGGRVEGQIDFLGRQLTSLPESALTKLRGAEISLMVQDSQSALNPAYRIGGQIMEMLALKRPEFSSKPGLFRRGSSSRKDYRNRLKQMALEMLLEVDMNDPEECFYAFPHQLSGGMRQRATLAMAMLSDPKLLIADEPTTALDVVIQKQILRRLVQGARKRSSAVILISHDLHLVGELADSLVVLYAGKIMEYGPTFSVLNNPGHPYTRALSSVMPQPDSPGGSLKPIWGEAPPPEKRDQGCLFRERCEQADAHCSAAPDYLPLGPNWATLCHYPSADGQEKISPTLAA